MEFAKSSYKMIEINSDFPTFIRSFKVSPIEFKQYYGTSFFNSEKR